MPQDNTLYARGFYDPRRRVDKTNFRFLAILMLLSPGLVAVGGTLLVQILTSRKTGLVFGKPPAEFYDKAYLFLGAIAAYFVLVLCINRIRDTGKSIYCLLIPGYNIYLLFWG